MGIRFMAASKRWAFPIHSPQLPTTPSPTQQRPTSLRGREASVESRRLTPHVTSEEGELLHRDALTTYACSYRSLHSIEKTCADAIESKGELYSKSIGILDNLNRHVKIEGESVCLATSTMSDSLQFSLMMDNLDSIADIFAGKDLVMLERDILVQLERLGAMRLFRASLSRTFMAPTVQNPKVQVLPVDYPVDEQKEKENTIVRTGKKEQRKSRRRRASGRTAKMSNPSATLKKVHKFEERTFSDRKGSMVSVKLKRLVLARNESQMSSGVKELADLHRICTELEGQIGRAASYAKWAESAGIDQSTLQQRLQFGWYCRDKLIKSTHSLVVYIARNYRGVGIAFDDLLQAGAMGVLKGAERFDHTRGYRFSTYVQYWIRKSMLALVARNSKGIQIPAKMHKFIKQMQKARRAFYCRTGRYPSDEETADITGLSLANVRLARSCSRVLGSIDQEIGTDWCIKYMEVTPDVSVKAPEEMVTRQHMKYDISKLLESLHPKERQVLMLRYGLDDGRCKSLDEIGRHLRVTKEWIRQLQKTALEKLRRQDIHRDLEYYLQR